MNKDNIKTMTKADVGELKSGDIVYIRMRVSSFYGKEFDSDIGFLLDFPGCCGGTEHRMPKRWLHRSIMREIGIKNTENAPKYDPCRKFRRGDKVRVVDYKGRNYTNVDTGKEGVVSRNETGADPAIEVVFGDDDLWDVDPAYLELVTPVEELERYSVCEGTAQYLVKQDGVKVVSQFCKLYHPHAKDAAEAECARLNDEYRKETK